MQHAITAFCLIAVGIVFLLPPTTINGQNLQDLNFMPELLRGFVTDDNDLVTLNLLAAASNRAFRPTKIKELRSSYDYVIVGSGPAGCVLANRLTENTSNNVLLIEAGQPETFFQTIPLTSSFNSNTNYLRTYHISKTPNTCLNIIDQMCPYPVGEALGGSSVVNYLIYTRGNRDDFDRWEAIGNPGWGYNESVALYEEFEQSTLSVENPPHRTKLLDRYLEAGRELNVPVIDYNGVNQMGIGLAQGTSLNGKRVSAAEAYLFDAFRQRSNLHILTKSVVTRILINNSSKTAYGVNFQHNGREYAVTATQEVIVSAGPFRSAQLLMVSGIGPREHLLEKNVPFIYDLPVGRKFFDHVAVEAPTFIVNTSGETINMKRVGVSDVMQFPFGRGIATMFLGLEALAFHKTSTSERPAYCPDLELLFMSGGIHSDFGLGFRKLARIEQDVYDQFFRPLEDTDVDAWTSIVLNIHPRTTGRILLQDNSMLSDPIIQYPFFEDERDLEDMLEGIRIVSRYAETDAMKAIGAKIYDKKVKGCEEEDFGSDEYWRCYIRRMTTIMVHMVGTNKMGPKDDPEAVVDAKLRVHGINNLRVADTSVIPVSVSGHPQAFSYLIGERLARILKEDD